MTHVILDEESPCKVRQRHGREQKKVHIREDFPIRQTSQNVSRRPKYFAHESPQSVVSLLGQTDAIPPSQEFVENDQTHLVDRLWVDQRRDKADQGFSEVMKRHEFGAPHFPQFRDRNRNANVVIRRLVLLSQIPISSQKPSHNEPNKPQFPPCV